MLWSCLFSLGDFLNKDNDKMSPTTLVLYPFPSFCHMLLASSLGNLCLPLQEVYLKPLSVSLSKALLRPFFSGGGHPRDFRFERPGKHSECRHCAKRRVATEQSLYQGLPHMERRDLLRSPRKHQARRKFFG